MDWFSKSFHFHRSAGGTPLARCLRPTTFHLKEAEFRGRLRQGFVKSFGGRFGPGRGCPGRDRQKLMLEVAQRVECGSPRDRFAGGRSRRKPIGHRIGVFATSGRQRRLGPAQSIRWRALLSLVRRFAQRVACGALRDRFADGRSRCKPTFPGAEVNPRLADSAGSGRRSPYASRPTRARERSHHRGRSRAACGVRFPEGPLSPAPVKLANGRGACYPIFSCQQTMTVS
jgi:hypothetical protein